MELIRTKVHMLPAEIKYDYNNKILNIILPESGSIYATYGMDNPPVGFQHLYFTTDEEIKEGDHLILIRSNQLGNKGDIIQFLHDENNRATIIKANGDRHTFECPINYQRSHNYRKIIAATDPELTSCPCGTVGICHTKEADRPENCFDVLPQPSQATIKAYCEQGGFDEVDVEYEILPIENSIDNYERMVSDVFHTRLKVDSNNIITTHRIVEKMYSLDEMKKMWIHLGEQGWGDSSGEGFDKWIKENLKQ